MTKVKIMVTQADIDRGEPREGGSCPIALACLRAFPDRGTMVHVSDDHLVVNRLDEQGYGRDPVAYALPPSAQEFIQKFDGRQDCTPCPGPFEFEVERS